MKGNRTKVFKLISRAMEDTRGLDEKYPNESDAKELAETLNTICEYATDKIMSHIKGEE